MSRNPSRLLPIKNRYSKRRKFIRDVKVAQRNFLKIIGDPATYYGDYDE